MKSNKNNYDFYLEVSEKLSNFVVPNRVGILESALYIYDRIKAGFLFDNSSSGVLHGLATINRGLASFYPYIFNQISGQPMPNRDTNLNCNTLGVSASTYRIPRKRIKFINQIKRISVSAFITTLLMLIMSETNIAINISALLCFALVVLSQIHKNKSY